jgi:mitotic spindle assembly checkpoint protein MAD2B
LQTGEKTSERIGSDLGGVKSTPVRLVEAGEFILETWIEEGRAKFDDDNDDG